MDLIVPPRAIPRRIGLLPASFNPPTRAHVALAASALDVVDTVLLVLPRVFPHKAYTGASFDDRVEMLRRITETRRSLGAAIADGGLFIDIAREASALYPEAKPYLLCGRDAAERIVGWDYGAPGAIEAMLEEFSLLVAPRGGPFVPPANVAHAVESLPIAGYDECASTNVREARTGWTDLVPPEILDAVERIYSPAVASRNARNR